MTPRPRKADDVAHDALPAQFLLCPEYDIAGNFFHRPQGVVAARETRADCNDWWRVNCSIAWAYVPFRSGTFQPAAMAYAAIQRTAANASSAAIPTSAQRAKASIRFIAYPSGAPNTGRIEAGRAVATPLAGWPRQSFADHSAPSCAADALDRSRSRPVVRSALQGLLTVDDLQLGISQVVGTGCASISLRVSVPARSRLRVHQAALGLGKSSCWLGYRTSRGRQFPRWQRLAINGKILPNRCGSRLCAENFGERTHRRNWNSKAVT